MSTKKQSNFQIALYDIMSGTFGGLAQVIAGHPLDTVKVRLQTQPTSLVGEKPQFNGMMDCFKKTWKSEGMGGLYKGASSPLAGAMLHNAGLFFVFGQSKELVWKYRKEKTPKLTVPQYFTAGLMTGFAVTVVEAPIDLLKCKLQAQVGQGQFTGVWDAAKKITKSHGIKGLYQGSLSVALRNTPCFASYFTGFEYVKNKLTPEGQLPSIPTCFLAGGAAGFLFWGCFYPLDIIKTRIQTDHTEVDKRKYKGILDCVKKIHAQDGIKGFFKGYLPSTIRGVFVNATIFASVNLAKRSMGGSDSGH